MIIAAVGSSGYDIVLILHLLFVIVAFAPAFVWPVMNRLAKGSSSDNDQTGGSFAKVAVGHLVDPMMHGASLVLAGVFGIGLIGMSDKIFEFSQAWVSVAFLLWFVMLAVFFAVLVPAQRAVREGTATAGSRLAMSYGAMHTLLLLQIIVMVWKPGL